MTAFGLLVILTLALLANAYDRLDDIGAMQGRLTRMHALAGEQAAAEHGGIRASAPRAAEAAGEGLDASYAEQSAALTEAVRGLAVILLGSGAAILIAGLCAALALTRRLARPLRLARESIDRLARGDLAHRVEVADGGELGALVTGINGLADRLRAVVAGMIDSAANISSGSRQIVRGVEDLSRGAEEQVSGLERTVACLEEMDSAARRRADEAQGTGRLIGAALEETAAGGGLVGEMTAAMSDIEGAGGRVAEITGRMDEIASRANLLALQAVVEAARAGRPDGELAGFAAEAHALAQKSAAAAKEIRGRIECHLEKVELGRRSVERSGQALDRILASVGEAAGGGEGVAGASREQAAGIGRAHQAMARMDEMARQNAALVEQASAVTRMMEEEACRLLERIACFRMHRIDRPVAANGGKRRFSIARRFGRDAGRNGMIGASAA